MGHREGAVGPAMGVAERRGGAEAIARNPLRAQLRRGAVTGWCAPPPNLKTRVF